MYKNKILPAIIRKLNRSFLFNFSSLVKVYSSILGSRVFIHPTSKFQFLLREKGKSDKYIYASRRGRLNLYYFGIDERLNALQTQYMTHTLKDIESDDLIVDIGANIGEFSMFWESRGNRIFAFEPDLIEYECLKKNVKGIANNLALWDKPGKMKFYLNNDTGDSSLLDSGNNVNVIEINVDTLDNIMRLHEGKIGLIKLEAEGGEPEILCGAIDTLKRTKYISVDVGLERGIKKESTLKDVCNILYKNDFAIVDFNPHRYTLLFMHNG